MTTPPNVPPVSKRSRWFTAAMVERVVLFSVVSVTGILLWSSVSRLTQVRTESRDLSRQIAHLSGEIDVMRAQWPGIRTQQVTSRMPEATTSLFQGPPAISEWIESVRASAIPLALETEFEFIGTRTQALDSVVVMQTRLHITPDREAESPRPAFHRLLELGQTIANYPKRLDVLELTLHGSSNSVGEASALIEVWSENTTTAFP